jgi:hypothetical protein
MQSATASSSDQAESAFKNACKLRQVFGGDEASDGSSVRGSLHLRR